MQALRSVENIMSENVNEINSENEEVKYEGTSFNEEETGTFKLPEGEPLCVVNYDVTIPEEEKGFKEFQKRHVRKPNIIKTVVFGLVFAVFFVQMLQDKSATLNWIAMTVAAAAIFIVWYNPVMIRKNLMKALEAIKDDKYIFKLYGDAFTIETIIPDDEFEEGEERIAPIPRVVWFDKSDFDVCELSDMFVIIMKKETIYVLPKRCMNGGDEESIRKTLIKG